MKILVLCTGNSCRSQMAEGFLRHFLGEKGEVFSAGLETHGVNPRAIAVMRESGIDISEHTSNDVGEYIDQRFDYIITVCDNAATHCPTFPGGSTKLHWPFDDPAKASGSEVEIVGEFRRVRDQIEEAVRRWLAELGIFGSK